MKFNPLEHPACLETPTWLEETAWSGHLPFAMFMISALRPRIFVELGVDRGTSYCTFCQTVKTLDTGTRCFGVDTWQGDEHAGRRDSDVLVKLRKHHDPLYSEFSRLIRSTFDEALGEFAEHSVDLLHIDGFHTYEAVEKDFKTWLPKMSDRGIVLFHDTAVRDRGFGVWKLFQEASAGRPHFEFMHSHGLGVLAIGNDIPDALRDLFAADADETKRIRAFFTALGDRYDAVVWSRRQLDYIQDLETYARVVKNSLVMSSYRNSKEWVRGVVKKILRRN